MSRIIPLIQQYVCWLLLVICFTVPGCGYGEVSPTSYELAKSLYNVSNRKLSDRLQQVTERIDNAEANEEVSSREAKWLRNIVEQAEREQWDKAMQAARRMMEDQISR